MLITWLATIVSLVLASLLWALLGGPKGSAMHSDETDDHPQSSPFSKRARVKSMNRATGSPHRRSKSVVAMGDALEGWVDPLELRRRKQEEARILIQVKGRKQMVVRQQAISASSLNQGDCFILDCGSKIYQWNGRTANRIEKAKAMDICLRIKEKERIGNAAIAVIDDCADHEGYCSCEKDRENEEKFWELICGTESDVKTAEEGGEDDSIQRSFRLFRIPPSGNGEPTCEEVSFSKLEKQLLSTESSFVLDCSDEVWVWIGRKSNKRMRQLAESTGTEVLKSQTRPTHAAMHIMWEGSELVLFMEKFSNWGKLPIAVQATPATVRAKAERKEFDVSRMLYTPEELKRMDALGKPEVVRSGLAKRLGPIDDGKLGKVRVWKALHDGGYEVRPEFYGHFWDADSYVVLYTHQHRSHEEHLLYFWQGAKSPITVKGAASVQTIFMNQGLEGISEHIRVSQFKEPEHFLNVFSFLKMHSGPSPSFVLLDPDAFEAQMGKKKLVRSRTYMLLNMQALAAVRLPFTLFHVRGRRVCQVTTASLAHSLNSNDCLIVCFTRKGTIGDAAPESKVIERLTVWIGDGSTDETQQTAAACATTLYPLYRPFEGELTTLPEGEEKSMLSAIAEHNRLPEGLSVIKEPMSSGIRLFLCSTSTGSFEAEELSLPSSGDLIARHMFIIDASPSCVYIWEGKSASAGDQQETQRIAGSYSKLVQKHKQLSSPVPVEYVKQGAEPALFKAYFFGWPTEEKLKPSIDSKNSASSRRAQFDRSATMGQAFRSSREFKRPPLIR